MRILDFGLRIWGRPGNRSSRGIKQIQSAIRNPKSAMAAIQSKIQNPKSAIANALKCLWGDLAVWGDIRALLPLAIWCGLNCVGAISFMRRWQAPEAVKLSAGKLAAMAVVAAALAIVARALLARLESHKPAG